MPSSRLMCAPPFSSVVLWARICSCGAQPGPSSTFHHKGARLDTADEPPIVSPAVSCALTADGRPGEAFGRPLLERPGGTLIDPWAKLPTSHDVARRARVSQSTVSRALRGDPRVSDATRARVVAAAKRLGYVRSERGRSLSTRRTNRIGVVVEDLENPFYLDLVNILHKELQRVDLRPIIFTPERTKGEGIERLVDGSIDGAVLTTCSLGSALPMALRSVGFPVVLLNRVIDSDAVNSCSTNNELGAALMSAEVLRFGHRAIGAIFGPRDTSTGRDRETGVRATLQTRRHTTAKGSHVARSFQLRKRLSRPPPVCLRTQSADLCYLWQRRRSNRRHERRPLRGSTNTRRYKHCGL